MFYAAQSYQLLMLYSTESQTPELSELMEIITPKQAANWKIIGRLLKLHSGTLDIIEHDHQKAVKCCNEMFSIWLDTDKNATWGKLKKIFNSPAITCTNTSTELATCNGKIDHIHSCS